LDPEIIGEIIMKLRRIEWTGFEFKIWAFRDDNIFDGYFEVHGDFFLIYILGLYIEIDLG